MLAWQELMSGTASLTGFLLPSPPCQLLRCHSPLPWGSAFSISLHFHIQQPGVTRPASSLPASRVLRPGTLPPSLQPTCAFRAQRAAGIQCRDVFNHHFILFLFFLQKDLSSFPCSSPSWAQHQGTGDRVFRALSLDSQNQNNFG